MNQGFSIEKIRMKCVECGDCWLWRGSRNEKGHPKYKAKSLRRTMYIAARGPIKGGRVISVKCGENSCLNPDHLVARTVGDVISRVYATTDLRMRRSIASSLAAQRRSSLSTEVIRELRQSDESTNSAAKRLGVHPATIARIRAGQTWREASPWAGLGARG